MNEELKKINDSLISPWESRGLTAEEYAKDLTTRWEKINDLINGRLEDTSVVKSTITDTIEFVTWAYAKKEITLATALISTQLERLKGKKHGKNIEGRAKGSSKIR